MYESRQAWRNLWGPIDDPISQDEYPDEWTSWENELLAPLITGNPDDIDYTSYEVLNGKTTG